MTSGSFVDMKRPVVPLVAAQVQCGQELFGVQYTRFTSPSLASGS